MFNLLFSFQGRTKRLKFFFTSLLVGILTVIGLLSLLLVPVSNAMSVRGSNLSFSDIDIGAPIILIVLLIFGTGIWVQMSLVWKRTRDMNEGMTVAYVYASCWALSLIPVIGLVFGVINIILAFILLFKPSRTTGDDAINPEIFGSRSQSNDISAQPATNFASQLTDQDLVARAAQLRENNVQPSIVTPDTPVQNTVRTAPKSFGRRSRVQH